MSIDAAIARRIFPKLPHPNRPCIETHYSSRMCGRGTKTCNVKHDEPWWTPGQWCKPDQEANEVDFGWNPEWGLTGEPRRVPYCTMHELPLEHEPPPPDLEDWQVFGQLLMWVLSRNYKPQFLPDACILYPSMGTIFEGSGPPRHALPEAIDKMLKVQP